MTTVGRSRWRGMFLAVVLLQGGSVAAQDRVAAPESADAGRQTGDACEGGIVVDDGTLETGYGWVPSVIDGRYVQRFERADLGADQFLREVCVCWTRTRDDEDLDFRVELYVDAGGEPRLLPSASVEASAAAVPRYPAGGFTTVAIPDGGWFVASDVYYVGVRWNPSADGYFFLCADHSEVTPPTGGFFTDDRADGWGNVLDTSDPIFAGHRAMMIRLQPGPPPAHVPAVGWPGVLLLAGLTALAGALLLGRR